MLRTRLMVALLAAALLAAACGGSSDEGPSAPDLGIERQEGYAVVVDQSGGRILIGFSADRNATSGDSYDVTQSVWRVQDGAWNEPPVTCLGKGQRLELGISKVENVSQPGLLKNRVIWVSCLSPAQEG
ncbi:MAG TPA: hypothetical protein VLS92_05945 [Acidimicrobiia bacterium]|nr:hypothetical protein [Acidimicrobiia bacterium]